MAKQCPLRFIEKPFKSLVASKNVLKQQQSKIQNSLPIAHGQELVYQHSTAEAEQ